MRKNLLTGPLLDKVKVNFDETIKWHEYPFSLNIIKNLTDIEFSTPVTFLVGENGTGKSTILESIAHLAGFNSEGGSVQMNFKTSDENTYQGVQNLAHYFKLSWRLKPRNGYFFRAESFFTVANYIDEVGAQASYGNKSLHAQSHGESFMSFFQNRLGNGGFFIFDEPEAALSPARQLSLLIIINDLVKTTNSQFIIATHSPILLAYPHATIYSCDSAQLEPIEYEKTNHYIITKDFLNNPKYFIQQLFQE